MNFSRLGISKHAEHIYITLIDIGQSSISTLVRSTGLHRPTVYTHIKELEKFELISTSKVGKRIFYFAQSPDRLRTMATELPKDVDTFIKEIRPTYERTHGKPELRWYQGDDVVTWVYDDVLSKLKKGDMFYRYESPKDYYAFDEYLPSEYFERVCSKKEIEKFVITNEKTATKKKTVLERVSRSVPMNVDIFDYDITQIIYEDTVAFIDFENKTGWIVENSRFAHFQKRLFQLLFKTLE
jgi:DNA-binding transcriptional regulator GbsR (MarR family)